MTVSGIINASQNVLARTSGTISSGTMSFLNDAAANKTLNMGEIIKGKVLRHIEGNQYLVKIGGQEKVVDSANPLRTSETLYGRVVGLGDKVHLVRANPVDDSSPTLPSKNTNKTDSGASNNRQLIEQIFAKFSQPLHKNTREVLLRAVNTATNKEAMVISGLLAQKLGLSVTQESLLATYNKISNNEKLLQSVKDTFINLDFIGSVNPADTTHSSVYKDVAYLLQKISEIDRYSAHRVDETETAGDDARSTADNVSEKNNERQQSASQQQYGELGRWILNSQSDGAVSHKYLTIPIYLAGQIVEVNLALFSQRDNYTDEDGIVYRKLVFSLETDTLGQVNIDALVANKNVSISIRAESESTVEYLASYMKSLKTSLQDTVWTVDSIRYSVQPNTESNLPLLAVVEHHITENSVNHLG